MHTITVVEFTTFFRIPKINGINYRDLRIYMSTINFNTKEYEPFGYIEDDLSIRIPKIPHGMLINTLCKLYNVKDVIINKADLGKKVDLEGIEISAKEQDILALTKEIKKKFNLGLISNQEEYYLTNARQTQLLEKAAVSLQCAIDAMKMSIPADLIVEDLYDSWSCLKEILGEQAKEDLLDELFKRFCIGK